MAITYPLSLPDETSFAELVLTPVNITAITPSEFSGAQQVQEHPGKLWTAEVELILMQRDKAEPWVAFLAALDGSFGTFLMGDPKGATPRGTASSAPGTPLVNGASQTGQTLAIDGAPNNATGYLELGDWISLGTGTSTRLYKITEQANTNGSGEVTLSIWPNLRTSPGTNDVVTLSSAKGTWRLIGDTPYRITRGDHFYEVRFKAVEAI